jgi:hypothetical protein
VRELRRAYEAARSTADADIEEINKKAAAHDELVEAGEATWTEYDEDGYTSAAGHFGAAVTCLNVLN